ncbi:DNA primase [Sneathiella chinensis]|uniref:DNA primase n=1 Tax=Sneathiella chinensis TaxID=349750 RepID=A0ABQ5U4S2_9PROT|nr:DNA primase [Sneathiella chinensis]GLQ06279.1 DNA primase [Sneathiella chinensis]
MAFPPQFLEEIRNRVSLADLIGRRTKLVKKGREYSGLCPFHNEKSPSFTVNEEKGFYHCFGCGAHGDQVEFVKQTEGVTFVEAIERLAELAGMQVPAQSPQEQRKQKKAATLHEVMETAATWFTAQLGGAVGTGAREYLDLRQVGQKARDGFRLGYAPQSRTALKEALLARGIDESLMLEAGLIIKPDDGRPTYDRFRDRLMFPIGDRQGRVIAFGGRALGDAPAKYLNSPDTPLFHKGYVLYNMAEARRKAYDAGSVIVAEGYMDVIALAEAGFENAVAPLGTAVTEDQLQYLWKMAAEPIMCLDGDSAGWRAALRAAERALPLLKPGHSLRFALLPGGVDPDDLIKQQGAEAMKEVLGQALPLSDLLWRKEFEGRDLGTPEQKAAFEAALFALCDQIEDQTVRTYYQKHFKDRLWTWSRQSRSSSFSPKGGQEKANRFGRFANQKGSGHRPASSKPVLSGTGSRGRREELLLLTVINHPEILENHFEDFAALQLSSADLDRLCRAIIEIATSESSLDYEGMSHQLSIRGLGEIVSRMEKSKVSSLDWFVEAGVALEDVTRGWLHILARHRHEALVQDIKLAQGQLEKEFTTENFERLRMAKAALEQAEGKEAELDGFGVASGRDNKF